MNKLLSVSSLDVKFNLRDSVFHAVKNASFEISENEIKNGLDIIKSLSETSGFLSSNSEARRALKENSISVNKTKVNESYKLTNADLINNKYIVLNRGKKKTFIIKVK